MWGRKDHVEVKEAPGDLKSLLVPVDGSTASMRAVDFACNLAKRNKGKVQVVHVIEVKRSLPLDAELTEEASSGEEILDLAELGAKRLDFELEGDLLQAREAGHAIIDEAVERRADAIIIGVPNHKPYGEFEMGKVPAHVLKSAPCQVIILRMA